MMSTTYSYLDPSLIKEMIKALNEQCLKNDSYYIGAVGDLLLETEYIKDGLSYEELKSRFKPLCDPSELFYIQDVSKEEVLLNMFIDNDGDVVIDSHINASTSPHFSINYLALKPNDNINFWDNDILTAMKSYYG